MSQRFVLVRVVCLALIILLPSVYALDDWYNSSWHFRQKLEFDASGYARYDWPIELQMNFTNLLLNSGSWNASFDNSSLRVFEYNSSGKLIATVPFQFDYGPNYSPDNAVGELVFLIEGRATSPYQKRIYFVYFDTLAYGQKTAVSFTSDLNYSWDGEEFNVNNSIFQWYFDSARGENTSGLYKVEQNGLGFPIFESLPGEKTLEYSEYANETHNFTFNFNNNVTFVKGPIRITAILQGDEAIWNDPNSTTGMARLTKKYHFYDNASSIKIEQKYENIAPENILRSSTASGALAFDAERAFGAPFVQYLGNSSDPASYSYASSTGGYDIGIINIQETNTDNFSSVVSSPSGRIGIDLSSTQIPSGGFIQETAIMKFNGTNVDSQLVENLSRSYADNIDTSIAAAERWVVNFTIKANHTIYNRNETVLILGNITGDIYNFTSIVNATLDNGTISSADDFNISLYDDGTHGDAIAGDRLFTNNFTTATNSIIGEWNVSGVVSGSDFLFLSSNFSFFNVTDIYPMNLAILNDFGLVDRFVNATVVVGNYRNDTFIPGAIIACNYPLNSSMDFGNGTYSISFAAPPEIGNFTLFCNATKSGNIGNATADFASEAAKTYAALVNSPPFVTVYNITQNQSQAFSFLLNATNVGNGTASFANITLALPANWTSSNLTYLCGNLTVGTACIANFTITVANKTPSGIYLANTTFNWQNPDLTSGINSSNTTVNVTSNPIMAVPETFIYEIFGVNKTKRAGNFTILSLGNDPLANVTFNVSNLPGFNFTFIPANLPSIAAGGQISVQLNVTVPEFAYSGEYGGIINITSANGGIDFIEFNFTVTGADVSIIPAPASFIAGNITQSQNQSFILEVNTTNIGNVTAYYANITLSLPSGITSNLSAYSCGNLTVGSNCSASFLITVMNATSPGTYILNASSIWNDLETGIRSNTSQINISVLSNPIMFVEQDFISGNASHGNTTAVANLTIHSNGNDGLQNVTIGLAGFVNFTLNLSASSISLIPAGTSQTIFFNVTIPYAYDPGEENGSVFVNTSNAGSKNITVQILVSPDRSWSLDPAFCQKTESPDVGTVCEIQINNTGNIPVDFLISPASVNYTAINTPAFTIPKQTSYSFNVTYNISGQPKIPYNSTYNISAGFGQPASRNLYISLAPFESLKSSMSISDLIIQNNQTTTFYFNLTDSNLVGIKNATAFVQIPNGTITSVPLSMYGEVFNATGNITLWNGTYPNMAGNTYFKGNYSVTIIGFDNVDVNGTANGSFYAYPKLHETLQTLSGTYAKGSSATIYGKVMDLGGAALGNATTTIWVKDPLDILVFNQTYVTAVSGIVEPLPTFSIAPDAIVGNWSLYSYTTYYDSYSTFTVNDSTQSNFLVVESSGGGNVSFSGLLTNMRSGDLYFGGDTVEIAISVYDVNGAPLDPDNMNMTIYAPNESVYSYVNFSDYNRSSIGLYYYKFIAPRNSTSGVYRAELNTMRGAFFNRNLALFRISSSLMVDVETSFVWYPASVMTFRILVYSGDGMPLDPSSLNLTVLDPANNVYFSVGAPSMTKQSTGYYLYNHAMGANTSTGNYYAQAIATKDNAYTVKLNPFRVSQGGPYDIRMELLRNQVYPGDYLDFTAVMENKGEVTQDVTLEYWVTDGVQTWYYGSEAILTPAFRNASVLRSAYIFTTQPVGKYQLIGRVTYDLIKPPIDVNTSFEVVARPAIIPSPTAPGEAGGTATPEAPGYLPTPTPTPLPYQDYSKMEIISYPDEVTIMAGEIKYPKIQVKNTGLVLLHNVSIAIAGIPLSWLEILPSRVNALAPGDIATFVLKITVPASERTAVRKVRAIALSSERKEEVLFDVAIFESKLALIEHQIQRLKEKALLIAKDAKAAEVAGKNVEAVWATIEQAQKSIDESEQHLRDEELDDALSSAQIADTLLDKAKAQLVAAPFYPPSYTQLPNWITLALGFVGIGMGFIVFWFVRKRKKKEPQQAQPQAATAMQRINEAFEKTDTASIQKEKSKLQRALRLLESELNDGSISERAHSELRRRYERKLAELDQKLSSRG